MLRFTAVLLSPITCILLWGCSAIAVDLDSRTVYMTSWIADESSEYLYMYDLDTEDYKGKMKLQPGPKWMQGIACYDGHLYVTSDDGDADDFASDYMYRIDPSKSKETGTVQLETIFSWCTLCEPLQDKLEFIKNPVIAEFLGMQVDTAYHESDFEQYRICISECMMI